MYIPFGPYFPPGYFKDRLPKTKFVFHLLLFVILVTVIFHTGTSPAGEGSVAPPTYPGYPSYCNDPYGSGDAYERDCPETQAMAQSEYDTDVQFLQSGEPIPSGQPFTWCTPLAMATCPVPTDVTTLPGYSTLPYSGPGNYDGDGNAG